MQIRCPRCQTLFNADAHIIQAANGLVRCSHCQGVFNAAESRPKTDRFGRLPAWIRRDLLSELNNDQGRLAHAVRIVQVGGAALLLILLIGQLIYSQIGWMSQIHFLRNSLAVVCRIADCQLPSLRRLELIRLTDSKIIHRDQRVICLQLSMFNQADIEQPYPTVRVTMSNYLNLMVAEGYFQPEMYNPDSEMMPAGHAADVRIYMNNPERRIRTFEVSFF